MRIPVSPSPSINFQISSTHFNPTSTAITKLTVVDHEVILAIGVIVGVYEFQKECLDDNMRACPGCKLCTRCTNVALDKSFRPSDQARDLGQGLAARKPGKNSGLFVV
jgi:hypothetical protein